MSTTTTSTSVSLPKYQEQYLKDLLASTQALANQPVTVPDYQVAGMTPAQQTNTAWHTGHRCVSAYDASGCGYISSRCSIITAELLSSI